MRKDIEKVAEAVGGSLPRNGMKYVAQDVVDFYVKYGIQYAGDPRLLPESEGDGSKDNLLQFRIDRLHEEVKEYVDAARSRQLDGQLDALLDLIYIALGNLHLHGFTPKRIQEGWDRVQRANMAKALASKSNPGKYGSKVDIVKPPGWTPPDHLDLCEPYEAAK